jgi:hypothetical protein
MGFRLPTPEMEDALEDRGQVRWCHVHPLTGDRGWVRWCHVHPLMGTVDRSDSATSAYHGGSGQVGGLWTYSQVSSTLQDPILSHHHRHTDSWLLFLVLSHSHPLAVTPQFPNS